MKLLNELYQVKGKLFITIPVLFIVMNLAFTASAQDKKSDKKQRTNKTMNNGIKEKVILAVDGMACMSCVANVKRTVASLDGVDTIEVSLANKNARITYDAQKVDIEKIRQAINGRGFTAGEAKKENK
jgi:copper ion binding protein